MNKDNLLNTLNPKIFPGNKEIIKLKTLSKKISKEQPQMSAYLPSSNDIKHHTSTKSHEALQYLMVGSMSESGSSTEKIDQARNPLNREEIISQRKLKVAARKQLKKLEKQQMNENTNVNIIEAPPFSLQLIAEDFPTLGSFKTKKKSISIKQPNDVIKTSADQSSVDKEPRSNKTAEKSWKPKIKDPIHIDLSQALQNNPEKQKPLLKKTDPSTQRNLFSGNILDSDNPKRKKGKVRPDKIPKPSKLKNHILIGRKKKLSNTIEHSSVMSECLPFENTEQDDQKVCVEVESTKSEFLSAVIEDRRISSTCDQTQGEDRKNVISPSLPTSIHSRRFREYCTNILMEDLITSTCALLEKVAYFQDRTYARDPIKASAKRRYVAGINQVSKYLQVKKVKLLVIAPDLEKNPGEGGLDERVEHFKMEAELQKVPCVFGPNRKRLGKSVKKNTLVSCVAVLSYEGAEEQYNKVLESLDEAKAKYLVLTGSYEESLAKSSSNINVKDDCYASVNDVTSSLLATLREELPPAQRLLDAIQHADGQPEVTT